MEKLNNNTWFNDEPLEQLHHHQLVDQLLTNPLTTFTTDPVRVSYREIAIKDKQGVETFVESYPIKL
jgi:hypothetical protein